MCRSRGLADVLARPGGWFSCVKSGSGAHIQNRPERLRDLLPEGDGFLVITDGDHGININDWRPGEVAVESGGIDPLIDPGKEMDMIDSFRRQSLFAEGGLNHVV